MEKANMAVTKAYCAAVTALICTKEKAKKFFTEEKGAADFIAIVIILAIVVALCFLFRERIMALFESIWDKVSGDASSAAGLTSSSP